MLNNVRNQSVDGLSFEWSKDVNVVGIGKTLQPSRPISRCRNRVALKLNGTVFGIYGKGLF